MVRLKKIGLVASVLILLGSVSVWGSDAYENYRAKSVGVLVNEKKVKSAGLLVDIEGSGTTMLPIREVANELGVFVDWDSKTQTAHLHKPNVDLILATVDKSNTRETQYGLFQKVASKEPAPPFIVIAQIDSMDIPFHSYRFTIRDPGGNIIYEHELDNDQGETTDEIMWRTTPSIKLTFDQKGMYVVEFSMKSEENDRLLTVAKKSFHSQ